MAATTRGLTTATLSASSAMAISEPGLRRYYAALVHAGASDQLLSMMRQIGLTHGIVLDLERPTPRAATRLTPVDGPDTDATR